jgi:hypothetical protein
MRGNHVGRDIQDRIVARADALWQAHGCPKDCDAEYLRQASREIELNDQLLAIKTSEFAFPHGEPEDRTPQV